MGESSRIYENVARSRAPGRIGWRDAFCNVQPRRVRAANQVDFTSGTKRGLSAPTGNRAGYLPLTLCFQSKISADLGIPLLDRQRGTGTSAHLAGSGTAARHRMAEYATRSLGAYDDEIGRQAVAPAPIR